MRYSIVASAFGLFSVAVAEATVTITQVSTVFPSNCEASPTGATNPPGYGESTTVTVESTSVVQSTATVQTSGSTEVSPAGTSGTGVPTAPGPVTSETASTTEGAPAPSTTPGSTESGPESTTLATSASESASNTGSQSSTAPSAAASTNAPPAATGAADMKKPSVVGLAAIMAALVYL
ncbi:uncharacterized protein RHO25_000444 [Cercospora beticola]|nr:hypothetical protein RHO25_000444 [Cercospora beticola]